MYAPFRAATVAASTVAGVTACCRLADTLTNLLMLTMGNLVLYISGICGHVRAREDVVRTAVLVYATMGIALSAHASMEKKLHEGMRAMSLQAMADMQLQTPGNGTVALCARYSRGRHTCPLRAWRGAVCSSAESWLQTASASLTVTRVRSPSISSRIPRSTSNPIVENEKL